MPTRTPCLPEAAPPSTDHIHDDLARALAGLYRRDLIDAIEGLLALLTLMEQNDAIAARAPVPWNVGERLADHADPAIRMLGYVFQLQALLQTPEALIFAVRKLQAALTPMAARLDLPAAPTQPDRTTWRS